MAATESLEIPLGTILPHFALCDTEGLLFADDSAAGRKGLLETWSKSDFY